MKEQFNFTDLRYLYQFPPVSIENAIGQIGDSFYSVYSRRGLHINGYLNIQETDDGLAATLLLEEYESENAADEGLFEDVEYKIDLNESIIKV